jgi:hypothetical protein
MIPSTNSKLLVAEDWKKVYQSFKDSDFKSYDFETLRRVMISYLREKYPEDFNDYIESSEYIALIDLIAYLGQNLSFRVDLNARENFLETAERRDSVLRLAQLINYNPKRNVPANGLLKLTSISTSDSVFDANGTNLANTVVSWNDVGNLNWYQQFVTILNSAMSGNSSFGKPADRKVINGIPTEQYLLNTANTDIPVFTFTKTIGGISMPFEIVGCQFSNKEYIYESTPKPGNQFSFIFQNDSKGSASPNTGFFVHFRQGTINVTGFNNDNPVPNEVVGVDVSDINDNDVWLWQLDNNGNYAIEWNRVGALSGNNIIYNSVDLKQRNIYAVTSRENDQIDLNFADGVFGNLPKGQFRLFYRQSNGLRYSIKPEQINGIQIQVPYFTKQGQLQTLTMVFSLQYTVNNSESSESNESIKIKAPQAFYTQNRMITAEDYNIAPLTAGSNIVKVKSINRISSGVSKYFELSDVSGKYSSTNIFADDGILYKEETTPSLDFTFTTRNEIYGFLINQIIPILESTSIRNFYFDKWRRPEIANPKVIWVQVTKSTNQTTGYFVDQNNRVPIQTGIFSNNNLRYVQPSCLIKIVPPAGQYFLPNGNLTSTKDLTTRSFRWVKCVLVIGDGSYNGQGTLPDGTGPIILTQNVPSGAVVEEVIPAFDSVLSYALQSDIVNFCTSKRNFGLSFSEDTRSWYIIDDINLDLTSPFSLFYQKDTSNTNKDSSWLFSFVWNGLGYRVRYRITDYIFESNKETAFYYDTDSKNFDFSKNTVVKDQIKILGTNTTPIDYGTAEIELIEVNENGSAGSFLVKNKGTGYVSTPIINVSGGVGGLFYGRIKDGSVEEVLIINSGTGYSTSTSIVSVTASDSVNSTLPLGYDYGWQIDGNVVEPDGYIEPKKVKVSFLDEFDDSQIENPDAFVEIVSPDSFSPQTLWKDKFVFFKWAMNRLTYSLVTDVEIKSYPTEQDVPENVKVNGQLFYFYDRTIDVVKRFDSSIPTEFVLEPDYFARSGRTNLKFQYKHNSGDDRRLDPSKTNLIDIYLLTRDYDTEYRSWLSSDGRNEPLPPTSSELEENYSAALEPIKAISDQIIYQPVRYKVLFGNKAVRNLQATFKAVRNPARTTSENELKTKILVAIENFFNLENWDFGQTFYFSELSTYVMNSLTPDITNFILVPKADVPFGSLYEIACQTNEIFVNGASIDDIEIIDAITSSQIRTTSTIINSTLGVY